jgi:hypothetical protein
MKTKFILAIVILTLVISACAPALPAATITPVAASPTAAATATATPTVTRTPRPTQTSIPLSAEEQLWQYVLSGLDHLHESFDPDLTRLLLDEYISRFPDGSHINFALLPEMYMSEGRFEPDSPQGFCQLLADTLNTLQPQFDRFTLDDVLNDILQNKLGYTHTVAALVLPADNLFGDGQMGWAILIQVLSDAGTPRHDVLLALEQDPTGKYRVIVPTGTWGRMPWDYIEYSPNYKIYDANKNGIPEIGIQNYSSFFQFSRSCGFYYSLLEWDGQAFLNLTSTLSLPNFTGYCGDIYFKANPYGADLLIAPVSSGTGCSGENRYYETTITTERVYRWTGVSYQFDSATITDIAEEEFANEPSCLISYANAIGAQYPAALEILERYAIGDPLTRLRTTRGFAYQDYLKFKLGTWYALRGDSTKAIELMTEVAEHPIFPRYSVPSNLAKTYLDTYTSTGSLFKACESAQVFLSNERIIPNYSQVDPIIKAWGFSDGGILSENDTAEDGSHSVLFTDVCRIEDVIAMTLTGQPTASLNELIQILNQNQILYLSAAANDADQDGDQDFMVILNTQVETNQLWLFENDHGKIKPILLGVLGLNGYSAPVIDWRVINLPVTGEPISIFHIGKSLFVFKIDLSSAQPVVVPLLLDYYMIPFFLIKDFPQNGSFQFVEETDFGKTTYTWDPNQEAFIYTNTYTDNYSVRQITQSLVQDKDYSKAYNLSKDALAALDAEVCEPNQSCQIVIAELLYRMGVAAELDGSRAESNLAYQRIINEFSDTAYADIAAQRMQP